MAFKMEPPSSLPLSILELYFYKSLPFLDDTTIPASVALLLKLINSPIFQVSLLLLHLGS